MNCMSMPKSLPRSRAMACCSVSRSLPLTRTTSPWIDACTFSLLSLISLDDVLGLFGRDALLQRDFLLHAAAAACVIVPYSRPFSGTFRLTSFWPRISVTAFSLNSSELASRIL